MNKELRRTKALIKALDDLYPTGWPENVASIVHEACLARGITKGIFSSIQEAGKFLARQWASLENRYSRAGALAVAISSLVTFPLPGNITAIVAVAEGIRKLTSKAAPKPKKARPRNRLKGMLRKATPSANGKH